MFRIPINPEVMRWARERVGITQEDLASRFKKLPEWEDGSIQPTLKQLESFAHALHVPIGYLFLSEPPEKATLPISDFRKVSSQPTAPLSQNLLDTIYACQERQDWYQDFACITGEPELDFVGSTSIKESPADTAEKIRKALNFDLDGRFRFSNWNAAFRHLIRQAEETGILVMMSGIVRSNTHRKLEITEFRGFALPDSLAPLVFINGSDSEAAKMFTLVHQIAHIWLGATALSNLGVESQGEFRQEEVWCSEVAAEILVPRQTLESNLMENEPLKSILSRLVREFKVSPLIILRRLLDIGWIDRDCFDSAWPQTAKRTNPVSDEKNQGADFYRSTLSRVGHRFAHAIVMSTLEGQTLYRDAFRMLGLRNTTKFNQLATRLGLGEVTALS